MFGRGVERRLRHTSAQLSRLREELAIAESQLAQLAEEADDARLRALMSETPQAGQEHRDADRHATAMARHRDAMAEEIAQLEVQQDTLLDELNRRAR